jgi:hypothetical protein
MTNYYFIRQICYIAILSTSHGDTWRLDEQLRFFIRPPFGLALMILPFIITHSELFRTKFSKTCLFWIS